MIINISDDMIELNQAGLLKKLLADKTTKGHILWGTDAYRERGPAFEREREIDRALLLYENTGLIKTRARKAFEQQSERTKQHGEVFTPRWICDAMIDHLDEEWFGVEEIDFLSSMDDLFAKKKWKKYVDSRRLEITCGEGPFLVQRYDVSTGNMIPVPERKGILDRKLQAVSRYAETEEEWKTWAKRAFQAVYGYEFQGDNLLISRVNFMMTYRDFYRNRWQKAPELSEWEKIENIITWNLWQMDGLTGEIPYSRMDPLGPSLFELGDPDFKEEDTHPAFRIYDWRNEKKSVAFNEIGKRDRGMKFDYIIGNPPYQDETKGENETYAPPVYHFFMDEAYKIANKVELIHPARFLFKAGSTPKDWNKKMLEDPHFKILYYESNSKKVFPNKEIKGGVAISYHDNKKDFGAIGIFTPYAELNSILKKVRNSADFKSLETIAISRTAYRLTEKMHEDHPEAISQLSKGHRYDMSTNIFELLPQIFFDRAPDDGHEYLKILGRLNNARVHKYIRKDYVNEVSDLEKFKLFMPKASGTGKFGESITRPVLAEPYEASTETFLDIGGFDTQVEAENAIKYISGKFARALLGVMKATQDITPKSFRYIPLQDFTSHSDIDWSKSIPEIDRQLYRKYGLDEKEISFIESHVKEMK